MSKIHSFRFVSSFIFLVYNRKFRIMASSKDCSKQQRSCLKHNETVGNCCWHIEHCVHIDHSVWSSSTWTACSILWPLNTPCPSCMADGICCRDICYSSNSSFANTYYSADISAYKHVVSDCRSAFSDIEIELCKWPEVRGSLCWLLLLLLLVWQLSWYWERRHLWRKRAGEPWREVIERTWLRNELSIWRTTVFIDDLKAAHLVLMDCKAADATDRVRQCVSLTNGL